MSDEARDSGLRLEPCAVCGADMKGRNDENGIFWVYCSREAEHPTSQQPIVHGDLREQFDKIFEDLAFGHNFDYAAKALWELFANHYKLQQPIGDGQLGRVVFTNRAPEDEEWTSHIKILNQWATSDKCLRGILQYARSGPFYPADMHAHLIEELFATHFQAAVREARLHSAIQTLMHLDIDTESSAGKTIDAEITRLRAVLDSKI